MDKLTLKQEKFCAEYLIDGNATKAAKEAGYSEHTAAEMGYENLRKPHIKNKINEMRDKWLDEIAKDSKAISRKLMRFLFDDTYIITNTDRLRAADMLNKMTGGYELDNLQKEPKIIRIIRASDNHGGNDDGPTE